VQIGEQTDDNTNPMRRIFLFRSFDYFFYLSHIRAFSDPLIFGEVLVDSDYAEHLTSWCLKVEVGVRYIKLPDAEIKNFLPHFFNVLGFDFQPDRFSSV
jgi:hypothetical protein